MAFPQSVVWLNYPTFLFHCQCRRRHAVADRIAEILALPDAEKAGAAMKLLQEIDSLIPDDPAMAEVIAEEMKTAFASQLAKVD